METDVLVRGFFTGFAIATPIGPIGALCIRRALVDGRLVGWVCWLGVATADAFYSAVAAFGLTAVTAALVDQRGWIRLGGGLLLCLLGLRALGSQPEERVVAAAGGRLGTAYVSTFGLTLANPTTILSFAAIFSGTGALDAGRD
nr:LysE family transporter [Chloroflexia bacterium]